MPRSSKLEKAFKALHKKYKGYPLLGRGRNRVCYRDPDQEGWVLKIPTNHNGIDDNYDEARIYGTYKDGPDPDGAYYAKCWLTHDENGIPILHMEEVQTVFYPTKKYPKLPDWTSWVDCDQVGYTKDFRLVAYDYGRN